MSKLRLSHSSLDLFDRCGYRYYLKYIKKIVPFVPVSYPLVTGIAFHALAEEMYKTLNFDKKWLLANWKRHFELALEGTSKNFADTTGYEKILKYGYGLVSRFYKFAAEEGYLVKPYKAEWKFKLPHKGFQIVGKVDLLIRKVKFEIIDFKTSWKPCSDKALKSNRQLTLYDWAVKTELGIKDTESALFYPREPKILRTNRTAEDHASVLDDLTQMSNKIEKGDFAPNTDNCKYCDFKKHCKYYKEQT